MDGPLQILAFLNIYLREIRLNLMKSIDQNIHTMNFKMRLFSLF